MASFAYIFLFLVAIGQVLRTPLHLQPARVTANNSHLLTWWHGTGEINRHSPVADDNVRHSGRYSVQVSTAHS